MIPNINGKKVLFITGSGISAESGIKTFYSESGLYSGAKDEDGDTVIDCISASMLRSNPAKTWKTIHNLYQEFGNKKPNEAHDLINKAVEHNSATTNILTMNIDGFHTQKDHVSEIHGNINFSICPFCENKQEDHFVQMDNGKSIPECDSCGKRIHPDVVLFEQMPKINEKIMNDKYDAIIVIGVGAPQAYIYTMIWENVVDNQSELYFVNPYQTLDDVLPGFFYGKYMMIEQAHSFKMGATEFMRMVIHNSFKQLKVEGF